MTRFITKFASITAILLASAAPGDEQGDLIHEANAAFAAKDYGRAAHLYELAEVRAADPGLVAFNKAAALYRLERYREAELRYLRALEDSAVPPARRAAAFYDLGTALLHRSEGKDVRALADAVGALRESCRLAADTSLRADAAHNLELARLLWLRARESGPQAVPAGVPPDTAPPMNPPGDDPRSRRPEPGAGKEGHAGQGQAWLPERAKDDKQARETQETAPGRGHLGTLPDQDELAPLDPQDAAAHLRRAVGRILEAQRASRQLPTRSLPDVKDW